MEDDRREEGEMDISKVEKKEQTTSDTEVWTPNWNKPLAMCISVYSLASIIRIPIIRIPRKSKPLAGNGLGVFPLYFTTPELR